MKFAKRNIKTKSNWFDKSGVLSKIGYKGLFQYLNLYRYYVGGQDQDMFMTSFRQMKKDTGYVMGDLKDTFKLLIKIGIITSSITRWDRIDDDSLIIIYAADAPVTIREMVNGQEKDVPVSEHDHYISVDLQMVQYYFDNKFDEREVSLYCLLKKWSNNTERKAWISINKMSDILGISDDKIHKMIKSLNMSKLLCSTLRHVGFMIVDDKTVKKYRYEHSICGSVSLLESFKNDKNLNEIWDNNYRRWKIGKGKSEDSKDIVMVDQDE